jgi:hypothetical protein
VNARLPPTPQVEAPDLGAQAASRTTTNAHGSAPRADGARVAASITRASRWSGTGSGRKRRIARWVAMTSKKSIESPCGVRPRSRIVAAPWPMPPQIVASA